jgi:hypothetical protein
MALDVELCLVERSRDRVRVRLLLTPDADGVVVEEAIVQLVDAAGEGICPQLLLPISGRLTGHVQTTVELRAPAALSEGTRVVASVWHEGQPQQTSIPADPFTRLLDYLQGSRLAGGDPEDVLLCPLSLEEERRLEEVFPWVRQPLRVPEVAGVIEATTSRVEELAEELGLDEEGAAWLEELLEEP